MAKRLSSIKLIGRPARQELEFLQTGKIQKTSQIDFKRAKAVGERFLAAKWGEVSRSKKPGYYSLPLPGLKARLYGARHAASDLAEIKRQANAAVNVFAQHFPESKRRSLAAMLSTSVVKRSQTVWDNLRGGLLPQDTTVEEKAVRMQKTGKSLLRNYVLKKGNVGGGVIDLPDHKKEKVYLAKGWRNHQYYSTTPLHEFVHKLQQLGVIKIDIPFAEAIDTFYGLQNRLVRLEHAQKQPTSKDFSYRPKVLGQKRGILLFEENSEENKIGVRIGAWLNENLPGERGWRYLFLRTMDFSHKEALANTTNANFRKCVAEFRHER